MDQGKAKLVKLTITTVFDKIDKALAEKIVRDNPRIIQSGEDVVQDILDGYGVSVFDEDPNSEASARSTWKLDL